MNTAAPQSGFLNRRFARKCGSVSALCFLAFAVLSESWSAEATTGAVVTATKLSTAGGEVALPWAFAAILVICAGVFVRVFVSIRNNSRRARPEPLEGAELVAGTELFAASDSSANAEIGALPETVER